MEAGLDGPDRDVERRRHVGQRHPQVVVQDDDGAPLRIEPAERVVEQLAGSHQPGMVADGGSAIGVSSTSIAAAPTSADSLEAGVHGQAVEPGVETVRIAQPGQVAPGSEEGLLHDVARELAISEDESGRPVQPRGGAFDEHREGVMIASLCPLDERPLVHGDPVGVAVVRPRSHPMVPTGPQRFPGDRRCDWCEYDSHGGQTAAASAAACHRAPRASRFSPRIIYSLSACSPSCCPTYRICLQHHANHSRPPSSSSLTLAPAHSCKTLIILLRCFTTPPLPHLHITSHPTPTQALPPTLSRYTFPPPPSLLHSSTPAPTFSPLPQLPTTLPSPIITSTAPLLKSHTLLLIT